ncbi:CAP domain-containing protein [Flavobacterium taihuense]|uniref:CAP domain-containing protein n=1 Tax=Flavobacterium taihuense TaxID=2857508 RepID=A0ABS6XZX8_9FLAO|nr:CAP domain-containing protein [Flavobacterium taihuense]MBW4362248.1 CAP domain-containing protein [Flavobacterium taihuense]
MNAKLLRFLVIGFFLMIFTACTSEDNSSDTEAILPIVKVYDYSPLELETMALINSHRVSIGLNALEKINHVSYKSEEHDEYMIANNVVNHDDFVARSENIIKALGASRVSENIAYNYTTAKGAFDAWMNSPDHRQNIEGNFTHFGLAIRENPVNGRKYYTNIFVKI